MFVYSHNVNILSSCERSVSQLLSLSALDQLVRCEPGLQGGDKKGDLSRFVEEAVRAHILELTADQAKSTNIDINESHLTTIIEEAIEWHAATDACCT